MELEPESGTSTSADDEKCAVCDLPFPRGKAKNKHKIYKKDMSATTKGECTPTKETPLAHTIRICSLEAVTPGKSVYCCESCFRLVEAHGKAEKTLKRKLSEGSYLGTKKKLFMEAAATTITEIVQKKKKPKPLPQRTFSQKKKQLLDAVSKSRYSDALTAIQSTTAGRKAIESFVRKSCAYELSAFTNLKKNKDSILRKEVSMKSLQEFSWNALREESKKFCPLTEAALTGALESAPKGKQHTDPEKTNRLHGSMMAQLAFNRNKSVKFFQQTNAVTVRLNGGNTELQTQLNHLGVCMGYRGANQVIDRLGEQNVKRFEEWKREVEVFYSEPSDAANPPMGYTLTFDNVNVRTIPRYDSTTKDPFTDYNMVHIYAARDRVPSLHLQDVDPSATEVEDISIEKIVISHGDIDLLKREMVIELKTILKDNLAAFGGVRVVRPRHEYYDESCKKSDMIGMGVLNLDENKDIVQILETYQDHCPEGRRTILYGDQLSCERAVNNAQRPRMSADSRESRLQGLYASGQEWHCRVTTCQCYLDRHYNEGSATERGTLYQIRNFANQSHTTTSAKRNYNKNYDLVELATSAMVTLFALPLLGIQDQDQMPSDGEDPSARLTQVAEAILESVFPTPKYVKDVCDGGKKKLWCICRQPHDRRSPMVGCDRCSEWYHYTCVGVTEEDVPEGDEPWFCPECKVIDHKFEYTKSVVFQGLLQICIRDAIRHNDGPRMMAHWKWLVYGLFTHGHPKYLIEGVRLLVAVNGGVSERLQKQLVWNRTVNYVGAPGANKAADLQMEHYNRVFKDSLRYSGNSSLSESLIARHGSLVTVSREVRNLYDKLVDVDVKDGHRAKHHRGYTDDVRAVVTDLANEKLTEAVEDGRYHKSFPKFVHSFEPKNARALRTRILEIKQGIVDDLIVTGCEIRKDDD